MKHVVAVLAIAGAVLSVTTAVARAESRGEQLFSQKCIMCHVVKGRGGAIGPELTAVASRMSPADIRAQLENPKKKNPSSAMPAFRTLSKQETDALLDFLKTLK
jgi:mono/diheme cytochrome c family protein